MKYSQSICAINLFQIEKVIKKLLKNKINNVHVDFMDGHYVNNFGLNFDIAKYLINKYPKINFDAHLMVKKPIKYLKKLIDIGFKTIFIPLDQISEIKYLKILKKYPNIFFGVMIKSENNVEEYYNIIKNSKVILLMTIDKIGGTGESLNTKLLNKVFQIKKINKNITIYSDGGLRKENAYLFKKYLIDISIGGSIIYAFENIDKFSNWWNDEMINS
ncbi:beta/alpha barrel domain-containing protein [[Mycoplasma] collis]|uniref:ribulose-phosphate 3-epimerase n=1 Tax=[Mycoplasma] collis TaxID=2127 RepID=UPI00051B7AAE|nr:ribulose-phosphate 3-epimerase [[Mycoplasma] collis]